MCHFATTRSDVTVTLLDRPRHKDLIRQIREAGARIALIADGDVGGAIMVSCVHVCLTVVLMSAHALGKPAQVRSCYWSNMGTEKAPPCICRLCVPSEPLQNEPISVLSRAHIALSM